MWRGGGDNVLFHTLQDWEIIGWQRATEMFTPLKTVIPHYLNETFRKKRKKSLRSDISWQDFLLFFQYILFCNVLITTHVHNTCTCTCRKLKELKLCRDTITEKVPHHVKSFISSKCPGGYETAKNRRQRSHNVETRFHYFKFWQKKKCLKPNRHYNVVYFPIKDSYMELASEQWRECKGNKQV